MLDVAIGGSITAVLVAIAVAVRAFLNGRRAPAEGLPAPTADQLQTRVERVEDHYRRLERRFEKLQGEFSAYLRDRFDDQFNDEEYDDDGQEPSGTRSRAG